jgi:drug/metabolite transporter (DMT)-like permease
MLFIRFGVSALVMSLILLLRRGRLPRGRTLARLIGMGALGYVGQSFTFLTATRYASAGLVALLLYLYPLFVAVLSILFLRERLTLPRTAALALALVGTGLTVDPAGGQWTGILLAIGAALIYSFYILVGSEVMKHVTAIESSAVIFASAALVYAGLTAVNGAHFPVSPTGWLVMAGMILFSTLIPVATFLAGLERIGPTNAAMLSTLEPVVTVLLAAWLFGERLSPVVLLGGGLILASVVLLTRAELKREKR